MKKQFENLDYLSYVGGLLGLFAGLSFLSMVEIFYYFTVQLVVNYSSCRKSLKVNPSNQENSELTTSRCRKIVKTIVDKFTFLKESSIHSMNFIFDITRSVWERQVQFNYYFWTIL